MKQVVWIGGWGCPREVTRAFAESVAPEAEHRVLMPVPGCIEKLDTLGVDMLVGYSTGAYLLCGQQELMARVGRVVLVAPFCDFRAESARGGKTRSAQIRFLLRWLRRDPLAALQDFYQRAGLGEPPSELPCSPEELVWGIEQLATVAQPPLSPLCIANTALTAWVGADDPLLDAETLRQDIATLQVVAGAGHALGDFRKELSDALQ